MMLRKSLLPLCAAALALGACATDQDRYPSLSIREAERVSGSFQPVEAPPFIPAPQPPETLSRIDSLVANAGEAHGRFTAATDRVRGSVNAARGSAQDSEAAMVAQVAIADLESIRSETMIPLAELDRLYVDALTEEKATAEVEAAHARVDAMVRAQDDVIASLLGALPR